MLKKAFSPAKCLRKARSFLLIEVLLAIAIIGICVYPLLAPHLSMAQAQIKTLEKRKLERLADQTFIELVQGLSDNSLPGMETRIPVTWNHLENGVNWTWLSPMAIWIGASRHVTFTRQYEIIKVTADGEDSPKQDQYRLLEIHLRFFKEGSPDIFSEYAYRTVIERGGVSGEAVN